MTRNMSGMRGSEASLDTPLRYWLRWSLAALYMGAGILHVEWPEPFLSITPDWVPFPEQVILLTGLVEIACAIGLGIPPARRFAGVALALYAVCVFPANIKHAMLDLGSNGHGGLGWWYHAPRLMLQPVLVWAALYATAFGR